MHVWLPAAFDGLVTAKTRNAKAVLSPALQGAVLWPGDGGPRAQTWAIRPPHRDKDDDDDAWSDEPGPDRVWAETTNAGISVYADGEDEGADAGGCCCV